MNNYVEQKQGEFLKAIEYFKKEIANIRTGRANSNILEGINIEVYGTRMPINGVANINIEGSKNITIVPWDKSVIKDLEKAIVEADLGLGINNEGDKIRLIVPEMTEEKRRDLVRKLNEKLENARISIRQIRDDVKREIEEAEKDKEITEDDRYGFIEELDEEVENKNKELKEIKDKKEEDLMTV
ncbi:ribosome recycling factor [bacterium]|nr:ribosome recycling factor [bacterium]